MRDLNERRQLAEYGIHFDNAAVYAADEWRNDIDLAQDAQPQLITTSNAGIPAYLTTIIDPQTVSAIFAPMNAVRVMGGQEQKKGDWTTFNAMFPVSEPVGSVSSYGDFNNNGNVDANFSFETRQSYHFQTILQWGERQLAMAGKGAINYAAELRTSTAFVMNKFFNRSYFYGIAGLANYGLLNDPSLPAAITPNTKAAGGTAWAAATADEEYNDVLKLYTQLQVQLGGNIQMDTPMTLAMSTTLMPRLQRRSAFNVPVIEALRAAYPNLDVVAAPEYTTASGELMQLMVKSLNGIDTAYPAFTEKMRAHPVVIDLSAFKQKQSAGTWGAIIRRPLAIAQMIGL